MTTAQQRYSFFADAPDLSTFAFPDGGPEDAPDDAAVPTSRVQIAKTGSFKHPRYGSFKVTSDTLDAFIANFTAGRPTDQLPVDFDHLPDYGGKSEACGWIKKLEANDDKLFAHVEWTWEGAWAIREQRYRYVSPTWQLNYVDEAGEKRGPTMLAFGLTNRPFFEMPAVSLSQTFSRDDLELAVEDKPAPADPALFDRAFAAALRARRVTAEQKGPLQAIFAENSELALATLNELMGVG